MPNNHILRGFRELKQQLLVCTLSWLQRSTNWYSFSYDYYKRVTLLH